MKLLEERRTRLSLMVLLLDKSAEIGPITREVELRVKNSPKLPRRHRLGYWLFLDLPRGNQTIVWDAEWYEDGERAVNLETLPRLRPLVEVQMTPLLKITTAALAQGKAGQQYAQVVTASGGKTPLRFSGAGLPAGLVLDPRSGTIAGIPSQAGQSSVTLAAIDGKGSRVEKNYTLNVAN